MAAGAAAVTYAAIRLMELPLAGAWPRAGLMVAAFGYIFSAYSLGRMAESRAGGSGLTKRAAFYQTHRRWMSVATALLSTASIGVLVPIGWLAVALLGVSYAMALAYAGLLSPRGRSWLDHLRNVPASKDLVAAGGWTGATVLVPVVAAGGASVYAVVAVALFVFGLAFIRSVMFDFSDVMADRLLGRDTLPALMGAPRARATLSVLAGALALVLVVGRAAGAIGGPGYWMLLCPAAVLGYLLLFGRIVTAPEHRCAVVVDGGMLLAGLVALVHSIGS